LSKPAEKSPMSRRAAMGFDFEATHYRDHGIISPYLQNKKPK